MTALPPETVLQLKSFEILMDYERTLTIIAAFNDAGAEEALKTTGLYSKFDEPHSVRLARESLKRSQEIMERK